MEDGGATLTESEARNKLMNVLSALDLNQLLVENSIDAAVCLTADADRFVGARSNEQFPRVLQKMLGAEKSVWLEELRGGHLSFLFTHKRAIAPSIIRAFGMIH
jgi:hypothetical protein